MVVRDLWVGADVRWQGPETQRKGVWLRPGDRAVVVDAGRHHIASFSSLYHRAGTRRPRPGRGVTIEMVKSDETVVVPHKHLSLVAPDHPLAPERDGAHAAWWLEQLDQWGGHGPPVSALVPSSFPAVGQVLHPWGDAEPIRSAGDRSRIDSASTASPPSTIPVRCSRSRPRRMPATRRRRVSWTGSPPRRSSRCWRAPRPHRTTSSSRCGRAGATRPHTASPARRTWTRRRAGTSCCVVP